MTEARYTAWLARDPDAATRDEIEQLVARNDTAALADRFDRRLSFGTAGLRGLLGAGPNRMNRLVVRESTAGLGSYLLALVPGAADRGVVVGFDGRRGSRVFAEDVAAVLGALGIKVHLFDREAPTPVAGFAVRLLKAAAGIVITASHNPPDYNGYKVYWGNGAQIIAPHDHGIAQAIDAAAQMAIPWQEPAALRRAGRIVSLGDRLEEQYLDGVMRLSVQRSGPSRARMAIAYTPLHGVGAVLAEAALHRAGFAQVHTVKAQREPDGNFPTVAFPNPEEPGAMDLVLELGHEVDATLCCANDPDADRLAVAVKREGGGFRQLTGDELGALLADALLAKPPKHAVAATTIVSSRLLGKICRARNVEYFETLTGFKWIANGALAAAAQGKKMVFAYEEALGYAIGDLVWDKDGVSALVAAAELAAAALDRGESLFERLEALYRQHGLHLTAQRTLALAPGRAAGELGQRLRKRAPEHIAGRAVMATTDLLRGRRTGAGIDEAVDLPESDVLLFELSDGARVIVRPSGTEPKMKCYYETCTTLAPDAPFAPAEATARAELVTLMNAHQGELKIL